MSNPCCGNSGSHGEGRYEYCSTCGSELDLRSIPDDDTLKLTEDNVKQIQKVDDGLIGDVLGLSQALDLLRKALDTAETLIDGRNYEALSSLGYGEITEQFIFLQRVLGGLQGTLAEQQILIQDIAMKYRCAYEDIQPLVKAKMKACQPNTSNKRAVQKLRKLADSLGFDIIQRLPPEQGVDPDPNTNF